MSPDSTQNFVFDPIIPWGLILTIALIFAALTLYSLKRSIFTTGQPKAWFLACLRLCALILVISILARPSKQVETPPPTIDRKLFVALDTSQSMKQELEGSTRFERAINLLNDSGLIEGKIGATEVELNTFDKELRPFPIESPTLAADGETTLFHRSINSILDTLAPGQGAHGIIMLTDGHDFELINPAQTGRDARLQMAPIYPIIFGGAGNPRDVSVRITNYQPFSYVGQKAIISAGLRLVGVEYETLIVSLFREDEFVESKRVSAEDKSLVSVEFEVLEEEPGQFAYEVSVTPLQRESNVNNNSAVTFLNIINQQIQVLLIEAEPSWDTTFFQRSLLENNKIRLDSLVQYTPKKVRRMRQSDTDFTLLIPETLEELREYDVLALGRQVQRVLGKQTTELLKAYLESGGTIIFLKGPATAETGDDGGIQPLSWLEAENDDFQVISSRDGNNLAPFRSVNDQEAENGSLEFVLSARPGSKQKPLTAVLASAQDPSGESRPAFVHRRYGQGQVLSLGIGGLWRWAFNDKRDIENPLFTRFWDLMILWLMAGNDAVPTDSYALSLNTANITLGDKVFFRLVAGESQDPIDNVMLSIMKNESEVSRSQLAKSQKSKEPSAEFIPKATGIYKATADLPDGTQLSARFSVSSENLETSEVSADVNYLKNLAESSGGRILQPSELKRFAQELDTQISSLEPNFKREEIWNTKTFFYLITLLFGAEWLLRRRWGLA